MLSAEPPKKADGEKGITKEGGGGGGVSITKSPACISEGRVGANILQELVVQLCERVGG